MALSPAPDRVLSVSILTRLIKESLEADFDAVWVKGEVSGFKRHYSGHVYFTLKDGTDAVLDCAMYRLSAERLAFDPRDGDQVEAFGGIGVYAPRGKYQLIVKELRLAGLGALLLQLEELKRRLQAEGLFDPARKRPLPAYPRRIGLVTSPVGAAVRDVVKVLRARWPSIEIVLAPVRVQGPGAAQEISAAIARFNRWGKVDTLIVGRGGGSLEDLWAFNEEMVVRAVAQSRIPIISGIGHEVDSTLTDLAADARAATPSNAAEIAVRDASEITRRVQALRARILRDARTIVSHRRRHLRALIEKYGFRRQRDAVGFVQQRVDDLRDRLRTSVLGMLAAARERLEAARRGYGLREWPRTLAERQDSVRELRRRMTDALVRGLHDQRRRNGAFADRLRALSPRLVLERGFCIARREDGSLVRASEMLALGERLALEFGRGEADARVEAVRPPRADPRRS